jgi:hypothetical protein
MRAEHSVSQSDTENRPGEETGALRHTVAFDLETLATPRMRLDRKALMDLLYPPASQRPDPIAETLNALRRDLLSLVDEHTREERSFGFGLRPAEPLDTSELRDQTHRSLKRMEDLYEAGGDGLPLSHNQRAIILQANTLLREFLLSLFELSSDGTLNRSDTAGFLRQCIALGQILGQMSLALDSQRSGGGQGLEGTELP